MEGNTITSYENLCRIFEMRIKLDKEKGVKTSLDVLSNYEKYSKKIDSIYNNEFQKELKPLISPAVTLEKEEDRLRKLIKLLEDRLDRRIELEDRFYNVTGKYISGLQIIVSESELEEKRERLSLISNYLDTSKEISNVTESLNKLRDSLDSEEKKKDEYESKNKIMEDELYSTFVSIIKEDNYYKNINEEDINSQLDEIRSKVSETKETLDITKESIGSLITNGLDDDYTSYIEEAEKNYYNYKNKEIILKIYKLVMDFEDDFKLMCSKRESISKLLDEKKYLKESVSIDTEDELLSFEKTLLLQIKILDDEREILENIANYTSRIKFKEERLEELTALNGSAETLVILREYGLVDTYDTNDISLDVLEEDDEEAFDIPEIEMPADESVSEIAYDPYRIIEVKDYPSTLNVGLAKLKGESVREKVNKKLNPKPVVEFGNLVIENEKNEDVNFDGFKEEHINDDAIGVVEKTPVTSSEIVLDIPAIKEEAVEGPVWSIPTEVEPKAIINDEQNINNLPVWDMIQPSFETDKSTYEEIKNIDITSNTNENSKSDMFWIPVSDSKLETKDFPHIAISESSTSNGNFGFPTINS